MTDESPFLPPPPPPPLPGADAWAGVAPPAAPQPLRAIRSLAAAVCFLVAAVALVNLAAIPNDLAYITSLEDLADGDFSALADIEDQEDRRGMFAVLSLTSLVIAGVVWSLWQHRARANATALGAGGQRHGAGLAALGWIIPFANFVIPKRVVNDLWRASDPEGPPAMRIEGRRVWAGIDAWWALWVVGALIGRFVLQSDSPQDVSELDDLIRVVRLEIASELLVVVAAVLAVMIVQRVTQRLGQRATNVGTQLT